MARSMGVSSSMTTTKKGASINALAVSANSPRPSRPIGARGGVVAFQIHPLMPSLDRSPQHRSGQRGLRSTTREVVVAAASSAGINSAAAARTSPRPSRPIGAPGAVAALHTHTPALFLDRSPLPGSVQRGHRSPSTPRKNVAASSSSIVPPPGGGPVSPVLPESEVPGLSQFLNTLKFDANGMLVAIVQV